MLKKNFISKNCTTVMLVPYLWIPYHSLLLFKLSVLQDDNHHTQLGYESRQPCIKIINPIPKVIDKQIISQSLFY